MKIEIEINSLGEYLSYKRKLNNLTLKDVEEKIGVPISVIQRIEHDKVIKFINGIKLLNFYGITLEEIKEFILNYTLVKE